MEWLTERAAKIQAQVIAELSSQEFYTQAGIVVLALVIGWIIGGIFTSRVKMFREEPQPGLFRVAPAGVREPALVRRERCFAEILEALGIRPFPGGHTRHHHALGPGLGEVAGGYAGLSDLSKWVCVFAMLLGRLEIYTLLIFEYLILVLIISAGVRWLERRMGSDERS